MCLGLTTETMMTRTDGHTYPENPSETWPCYSCGIQYRERDEAACTHDCKNCGCGYCDGGPCCQELGMEVKMNPLGVVAVPSKMVTSVTAAKRLQLVVTHNNENVTYYPVGNGKPWKVDAGLGLLVVGKGTGRMMVPLCNIMYFTLEEY